MAQFNKPATLTFVPPTINTDSNPLNMADMRYVVTVSNVLGTTEHVGTDIGGGLVSIPLAAELPDAAGNYSVAVITRDISSGLESIPSLNIFVAVTENFFAPLAPTDLVAV